jgi:hypothetical protein
MKRLFILIIALCALIVAVSGCSGPMAKSLEKNKILGNTVAVDSIPQEKRKVFHLSATEEGFDLDTIKVQKNDYVRLIITNRMDTDMSQFYIEGYNIEDYYSYTESIEVAFVAYKTGSFEYGDSSRIGRKGLLVVE